MTFESVVPILYSADVGRSIAYYMEQLAFDAKWAWDDPTTFGGVSRDCVRLFFCLKCQGSPAHGYVKGQGAKILSPPEDKEWFMREMLVEDPDGHIIRFGHGIE